MFLTSECVRPKRKESQGDGDVSHTGVGLEECHEGEEHIGEEHGVIAGETREEEE